MNSDYWLVRVLPEKVPFSIKGLNLSKLIMKASVIKAPLY